MSPLPIRSLTLYKQGIGYFERQGEVEESTITLVVPHKSINDVLKSLNVEPDAGQVLSVDYETPEDKAVLLSDLPVQVDGRAGLVDLLNSLRGSDVTLYGLDPDGENQARGRLIGVETTVNTDIPSVLLKTDDDVNIVPLSRVQRVTLHDERVGADVDYFLDVSRSEQQRASLTLRLTDDVQTLRISYQAPSPTWRVSYRLVGDGQGQARLVGWGIFDNTLDDDLEDVSLTLITGRPISFEYDLYQSRVPGRPHISDDTTALETVAGHPQTAEMISSLSHELRTPLSSMYGYADLLLAGASGDLNDDQRKMVEVLKTNAQRMSELLNDLFDVVRVRDADTGQTQTWYYRSGPLGDLKVSSSYFIPMLMGNAEQEYLTYTVDTPVSVRRGQSAMVPIIDERVEIESLCVFNGSKMSNHPLLVWRLRNTSAVALEQGPVTLVEEDRYLGEGVIRFTGVGDDIQIPYALEFGVLVSREKEVEPYQLWEVEFNAERRKALVTRYQLITYTYVLVSHCNHDVTVLIERRDPNRGEYYEMPDPDMAVEGHSRWAVAVPAGEEVDYTIRVREFSTMPHDVLNWQPGYIEELVSAGIISHTIISMLQSMAEIEQDRIDAGNQIKVLKEEYQQVVDGQEQLRQNLKTLGDSARETTIRDRILDDLENSENRRREIETTIAELEATNEERKDARQSLLDDLFEMDQAS